MKDKFIFIFLSYLIFLSACQQNNNVKIVKSFIEYSNSLNNEKRDALLSVDFNKEESISLVIRLDSQSVEILKERIIIDDIRELDKNTIVTREHYEDAFSEYFNLEMMSYEVTYFVANSKIISIELNQNLTNNDDNIKRYKDYMEKKDSFSNWFQETHPKYNKYDYIIENGMEEFFEEYSNLPDSIRKIYHVSY